MPDNRSICAALQEMRFAYKTRNFSYLNGLIEEAQSYANRMESALQKSRACALTSWTALHTLKPEHVEHAKRDLQQRHTLPEVREDGTLDWSKNPHQMADEEYE
jgi:hypothetical protein